MSAKFRSVKIFMSQLNEMTIKTQLRTDKWAMTLSFVCALHCLLVPSFFILTSGFFAISIDNEFIHYFILSEIKKLIK